MAASVQELSDLHSALTESLVDRLRQDKADGIPTDAATLGAIIKLLKDNNITADPAGKDDLSEMRQTMKAISDKRKLRVNNVIALTKADEDNIMVG
jgi:hypothetical protein